MVRFQNTEILKRTGVALLRDGTLCQYKFSYDEASALDKGSAFHYFFDNTSKTKIPVSDIYAIKFQVGLTLEEQGMFCRGLAKMSIGALAYTLRNEGFQYETIRHIFSQSSIDSIRHLALSFPWLGNGTFYKFSLGRTEVLFLLHCSCSKPFLSNHVIRITVQENNNLQIEGMLFSRHSWLLEISNDISIGIGELRLENPIYGMSVPKFLHDKTLSPDSICIINPQYNGQKPAIPQSWENSPEEQS
ncbi:MAG: hypothetical protein MUO54_07970 [Anaerolineales bacterium]|nr:hypothetical protein [Anaerolineales bacterium]